MEEEWPPVALGEIAAAHPGAISIGPFGSAMNAETYFDVGVPAFKERTTRTRGHGKAIGFIPETFADSMPRCAAKEGDLVFPHRGSKGEIAIIPE